MLKDKALALRADQLTKGLLEAASVLVLGEPTMNEGETYAEFMNSSTVDPEHAAQREYHFVELYQQAMCHLVG